MIFSLFLFSPLSFLPLSFFTPWLLLLFLSFPSLVSFSYVGLIHLLFHPLCKAIFSARFCLKKTFFSPVKWKIESNSICVITNKYSPTEVIIVQCSLNQFEYLIYNVETNFIIIIIEFDLFRKMTPNQ